MMMNFVDRVLNAPKSYFPVWNLLDTDGYKITMLYYIWKYYRDVKVVFELINRDKHIPVAEVVDEWELRAALNHMLDLRLTRTEMTLINGTNVYHQRMFPDEFITFLANFRLGPYELSREGNQYHLRFPADWPYASMWEIYAMAIVMDLYFFSLERRMSRSELTEVYARAVVRHYDELRAIKANPNIMLIEGGTRRRHNYDWHKFTLEAGREILGQQLTGTSNLRLAFKYDMEWKGTSGHELQMVTNALVDDPKEKIAMQYKVCAEWQSLYGPGLRVMLPDTFMSDQFFRNAPDDLLRDWAASRQDSGDPFKYGDEIVIPEYTKRGIDPCSKIIIFSDGNKAKIMDEIERHFHGRVISRFLQGTFFTNNFGGLHPNPDACVPGLAPLTWKEVYKPFSLVCKVVEASGRPCVKLSDNPAKATGPKKAVEESLAVFGADHRVLQEVLV